jgi:hypothetical protein
MKLRYSILTAVAALACAAAPASALSYGYNFGFPAQSYSCDGWSQDNEQEYYNDSWSQGSFSFGCMGSESTGSGGYVMTFQSGDGSSFHCTVTWQEPNTDFRTSSVPDGGSTLALLGLTLAGFVTLRRRRISGSSV